MSGRGLASHQPNNSSTIRQEIQRFESVHPSIYAIYDIIEQAVPDPLLKQHLKEHVVCIEDSFVNSQEWTLSRSVADLKLGVLGTVDSGKSSLVHRYLTGSYMQEESPEGGRFKKEVLIDGHSCLLLIRDEGGEPELQFTQWVDAIIFVFSLENENSFKQIYRYFTLLSRSRNIPEVPIVLVGTQDAISESNPRVIDDSRARRLASDLKCCNYYETCATYGLNVERVFQDACQRIAQLRYPHVLSSLSRPNTPSQVMRGPYIPQHPTVLPSSKSYDGQRPYPEPGVLPLHGAATPPSVTAQNAQGPSPKESKSKGRFLFRDKSERGSQESHHPPQSRASDPPIGGFSHPQHQGAIPVPTPTIPSGSKPSASDESIGYHSYTPPHQVPEPHPANHHHHQHHHREQKQPPPPSQTPILSRKTPPVSQTPSAVVSQGKKSQAVQKSNSFSGAAVFQRAISQPVGGPYDNTPPSSTPQLTRKNKNNKSISKKDDDKKQQSINGQLGSGRTIPLKQGWLYKKSNKPLNKEWKKKYVTLLDDGRLTYHASLHDYMDDLHGKEINLKHTTVKVPGQKPRGSRNTPSVQDTPATANGKGGQQQKENIIISAFEPDSIITVIPNTSLTQGSAFDNSLYIAHHGLSDSQNSRIETPNAKKRHKRVKSSAKNADTEDADGYEFHIVSLDNRQWHFEAPSLEERDEWVSKIENQILSSLQLVESDKSKSRSLNATSPNASQVIRAVKGNHVCADCDAPSPDWASLNLGGLICIECSGIHRNLGTHLSRVRSLDLDEWPPELVLVMQAIGNTILNSIYEGSYGNRRKPTPNSSRDEKEIWIRSKYEQKEFLPSLPYRDIRLSQQLIDKVARQDVTNFVLVLAHCMPDDINAPYNDQDTKTALHIAAGIGNVVMVQMLLWYGANVKKLDNEHHNALYYALQSKSQPCVNLLRSQGCPENPTLPRRRPSSTQPGGGGDSFEKMPSSVI